MGCKSLMDINLFILFFISLPEAFLNLTLILLFSEQKNRLEINKQNIIRFIITLLLMLIATWVIRPLAPSVVANAVCSAAAYIVIVFVIYRRNIGVIALSVTSIFLFIIAIENTYIPFIITYHVKSLTAFFGSNLTLLLCSLPVRVLQVLAIALLWKYNDILEITRINKKFRAIFISCNIIIFTTEEFFSNIFVQFFNSFSLVQQIVYAVALLLLILAFNTLIFTFMYIALKGVMILGFNRYYELENDAKYAFKRVYSLLKNKNDTEGAINVLEEIIGKEEQ